ncbi:hypothetical protein [Peterkaempfera griseoplana]|uniref:hypothetical protein n=1 Tax=Peterkaempfera griseoplana TaxID=66896 RepID=UPI0012FED0FA|nr:hypothetical protein [Peterkaempfera griseoplana]
MSASSTTAEAPDPLDDASPATPRPVPGPGRGRTPAVLPLLVVLVFAALQVVAHADWTLSNDSYRYARHSLEILGSAPAQAQRQAVQAYCASRAEQGQLTRGLDPVLIQRSSRRTRDLRSCVATNQHGLDPADPRYERIFDSRPGYPLLISPAVAALGVARGMWLTGVLITAGASLLVVALLRQAGASRPAAVAGQLLFLCSRLGWWSTQPLAEGAVSAGVLAALLGAWRLLHGSRLSGAALLTGALAATALVKYSTAMMLAIALALAAGCVRFLAAGSSESAGPAPGPASAPRAGTVPLALLSTAAAVLIATAVTVLRLPDVTETLQDTFTHSFHRAPVADPWPRLLRLDLRYWAQWGRDQAAHPLLPLLLCVSCWALLRRGRVLGVLAAAAAALGLATAAAHPVADQQDRLWALIWVPVVLGLPRALDQLRAAGARQAAAPLAAVPSASVPSGSAPPPAVPSAAVPSASVPSGSAPPPAVPSAAVPSAAVPSASVPPDAGSAAVPPRR